MSPIKPEERSKVIMLSSGIVVVFGIAAWNLWQNISPRSAAPAIPPPGGNTLPVGTANAPVNNGMPPTAGVVSGGERELSLAQRAPEVISMPDLAKNPFDPITIPAAPPPSRPAAQILPAPPPPAPRPNDFVRPASPPYPAPAPVAAGVPPVTLVEPALELVGVVTGQGGLAMFRSGEQQLFIHLGEMVVGYRLIRIDTDEVMLRRGNRLRILRVGAGESIVFIPPAQPRKAAPVASPAYDAVPFIKPIAQATPALPPVPKTQLATAAKPVIPDTALRSPVRRANVSLTPPKTLSTAPAGTAPVVAAPLVAPAILRQTTLARPIAVMPAPVKTTVVTTAANPVPEAAGTRILTADVKSAPVSDTTIANTATAPGSTTVPVLPGSTAEVPAATEDTPPAP